MSTIKEIILFNYHLVDVKTRPLFAPIRRLKLKKRDFTIISNNCWGGICYEYYGIRKLSPTVGMYFYAEDYIKFIANLRYYLSQEMTMIPAIESKHYESLKKKGELWAPVGKIDDIEVVFLHYRNPEIAKEKWQKRVKRINWNNIIYKFSYMNECSDEMIDSFLEITKKEKRICFVGMDYWKARGIYEVPVNDVGQVVDDTTWFKKYVNISAIINE